MKESLSESEAMELMGIYLYCRKLEKERIRFEKRIDELFESNESYSGPTQLIAQEILENNEMTYNEFKRFLRNKCHVKQIINWVPLSKKFFKEVPKKLQSRMQDKQEYIASDKRESEQK